MALESRGSPERLGDQLGILASAEQIVRHTSLWAHRTKFEDV